MFLNGASVPHGLVESNTGWRDWAPPGWLRSPRLAAAFRRSLLTVTPSADLHHIAEHFELFPADQTASQNNRREDWQSLLDASSALLKCFSQHPDPSLLVSVWGRQIKCTFSLLCFDVLVDWLLIMFNLINLIDQFEDSHYAGMICYGYAPSGTAVQDSRTAINNSGSQCIMFSCGIVFLWFQYSSRRKIGVQRQWKEDKIAGTWNYFVFLQLCSLNLNHPPPLHASYYITTPTSADDKKSPLLSERYLNTVGKVLTFALCHGASDSRAELQREWSLTHMFTGQWLPCSKP